MSVTDSYAFQSPAVRRNDPKMDFYERIDKAFKDKKVNRAQVGRETGISGQGVTQKLKNKSAITTEEIAVYARHAGMTISEAMGDKAVVIEEKQEQDLVDSYRKMTPEQRDLWLKMAQQMTAQNPPPSDGGK